MLQGSRGRPIAYLFETVRDKLQVFIDYFFLIFYAAGFRQKASSLTD